MSTNQKFKDTFRVLMVDQHFPNAPYITLEKFDAADQVKRCKEALVDSLHVTMKCHWGYSYYNTRVGVKHPALGDRDQAGELISEIGKAGLEAIAYYCILFDNLAAREHQDWRFIRKDGKPTKWHEIYPSPEWHSWDMPCFMTGYRQYCLEQIREFSSNYDLDGLFLDIVGLGTDLGTSICYCPDCRDHYKLLGLNPYTEDPVEQFALIKQRQGDWSEFIAEIRRTMEASRPGMSLSVNGGPFVENPKTLEQVSWPYNEGGSHAYNCIALRGTGIGSPQCGIPAGNDAYDAWPPELVKIMTSTVLAHGCRTFFYFTQGRLPDGSFEESKYDFIRGINQETMAIQEYVKDAVPLTAAAVYHSESSWMEAGTRNKCALNDTPPDGYTCIIGKMLDVFRGVSIPCELISSWRLTSDELERYQLVVLPEHRCMSDEEANIFTQYVENGGTLVVTGNTGLHNEDNISRGNFVLSDLLGIDYEGMCLKYQGQEIGGYMRSIPHPFFSKLRKADYFMPGNFIQIKARDAEVLAYVAEPVAVENQDSYIGWGSLPPGSKAEWPCLTVATRGKGKAIYCAAPLGLYASTGVRWPIPLIQGIAESLNVHPGIRFEGPEVASEATFFKKDGKLIVHMLNQSVRSNEGVVVPLRGCALRLTGLEPKSARVVYPNNENLNINGDKIDLPPVEIHTIVEMEM